MPSGWRFEVCSADLDFECLRFGVAGGIRDGERVSGGLSGLYVDAARVGGPNGIGLRFQRHGLGVGYAIADLHGFASTDQAAGGVEILDGQLLSAELFQGDAILLLLLLRSFLFRAVFHGAIFQPARKKNPSYNKHNDDKGRRGVERGIFEERLGLRFRFSRHGHPKNETTSIEKIERNGVRKKYSRSRAVRKKYLRAGALSNSLLGGAGDLAPSDKLDVLRGEQLAKFLAGEEIEIALAPGRAPSVAFARGGFQFIVGEAEVDDEFGYAGLQIFEGGLVEIGPLVRCDDGSDRNCMVDDDIGGTQSFF